MDGRVAGPRAAARPISSAACSGSPALDRHHAQEVERVRLIGVLRQGLLINHGGPIDVSPPVFLQGLAQVDGHH